MSSRKEAKKIKKQKGRGTREEQPAATFRSLLQHSLLLSPSNGDDDAGKTLTAFLLPLFFVHHYTLLFLLLFVFWRAAY